MACYHPLRGWRSRQLNESGKRSIVFDRKKAAPGYTEIHLPCGQCIGCRLERSRQWAVRCVHEASMYEHNCFLTLTYDDDHLPDDGSLNLKHFQDFMKRLRKKYNSTRETPIRFFHCGEYGDENARPHYHACIFNHDFHDKLLWKTTDVDNKLYTSDELSKLWPYGYAIIGDVTFDSAAYVARYIMKKVTGDQAELHYQGLKPEYITMSRRPGIGKKWFDQWKDDVYPLDSVIMNGKEIKPPRFYDQQYDIINPGELDKLKKLRLTNMKKHADDLTLRRLRVSEAIKEQKLTLLPRNYER